MSDSIEKQPEGRESEVPTQEQLTQRVRETRQRLDDAKQTQRTIGLSFGDLDARLSALQAEASEAQEEDQRKAVADRLAALAGEFQGRISARLSGRKATQQRSLETASAFTEGDFVWYLGEPMRVANVSTKGKVGMVRLEGYDGVALASIRGDKLTKYDPFDAAQQEKWNKKRDIRVRAGDWVRENVADEGAARAWAEAVIAGDNALSTRVDRDIRNLVSVAGGRTADELRSELLDRTARALLRMDKESVVQETLRTMYGGGINDDIDTLMDRLQKTGGRALIAARFGEERGKLFDELKQK